mgnify:CR=1 FL=1
MAEKTVDKIDEQTIVSHQTYGRELELFMFHESTPGSCFFLPHGTRIYNSIMNMLKIEYFKRGYEEVNTPNIYNSDLWKISGHWEHYKSNMFVFNVNDVDGDGKNEVQVFSNKPMNCPGHCLIFKHKIRSYKDLPIRLADFGVLHRNELSGSLRGLTRVRKFVQDDAHIFCRIDQMQNEIINCLKFLQYVYDKLNFTSYKMALSTRPDKYMGEPSLWETAQDNLRAALDSLEIPYDINDKDGAFYGPKIDIMIKDSHGRENQCGTIQLDFQLPNSFDLSYVDNNGEKLRPVIIHRAILGSFERMIGILLEHSEGKLPFWCSPRHVLIVPINPTVYEYCNTIREELRSHMLHVDIEDSTNTINNKIRYGETMKYNHILVIGNKEETNKTVNHRVGKKNTEMNINDFVTHYMH